MRYERHAPLKGHIVKGQDSIGMADSVWKIGNHGKDVERMKRALGEGVNPAFELLEKELFRKPTPHLSTNHDDFEPSANTQTLLPEIENLRDYVLKYGEMLTLKGEERFPFYSIKADNFSLLADVEIFIDDIPGNVLAVSFLHRLFYAEFELDFLGSLTVGIDPSKNNALPFNANNKDFFKMRKEEYNIIKYCLNRIKESIKKTHPGQSNP